MSIEGLGIGGLWAFAAFGLVGVSVGDSFEARLWRSCDFAMCPMFPGCSLSPFGRAVMWSTSLPLSIKKEERRNVTNWWIEWKREKNIEM